MRRHRRRRDWQENRRRQAIQLPSEPIDIEIPLTQGPSNIKSQLQQIGWRFAYTVQGMELQAQNESSIVIPPLEPEMKWQGYQEELFDLYYDTLVSAFGKRPGIVVLPREVQKERCQQFGFKLQLLTRGNEVLGFVRVEHHPDGTGELVSLARNPAQRGKGLGRLIVAKGIEAVKKLGANRVTLEVTLVNPVALNLYQEMGFRPTLAMDTWKILSASLKQTLPCLPKIMTV